MPPGKVLQPVLKMKVDELFLYWLSEASTQRMLQDCLRRIKAPGRDQPTAGDGEQPGAWPTAPLAAPRPSGLEPPGTPGPGPALPAGAASSPRNEPHGRGTRRSAGTKVMEFRSCRPGCSAMTRFRLTTTSTSCSSKRTMPFPEMTWTGFESAGACPLRAFETGRKLCSADGACRVQTRKEEPLPPATSQSIPTFYFPRGHPQDSINVDAVISKIESTFARFPHERATMDDMGLVHKVINTLADHRHRGTDFGGSPWLRIIIAFLRSYKVVVTLWTVYLWLSFLKTTFQSENGHDGSTDVQQRAWRSNHRRQEGNKIGLKDIITLWRHVETKVRAKIHKMKVTTKINHHDKINGKRKTAKKQAMFQRAQELRRRAEDYYKCKITPSARKPLCNWVRMAAAEHRHSSALPYWPYLTGETLKNRMGHQTPPLATQEAEAEEPPKPKRRRAADVKPSSPKPKRRRAAEVKPSPEPKRRRAAEEKPSSPERKMRRAAEVKPSSPKPKRRRAADVESSSPEPKRRMAAEVKPSSPKPKRRRAAEVKPSSPKPKRRRAAEVKPSSPKPRATEVKPSSPKPKRRRAAEVKPSSPEHKRQRAAEVKRSSPEPKRGRAAEVKPSSPEPKRRRAAEVKPSSPKPKRQRATEVKPSSPKPKRRRAAEVKPSSPEPKRRRASEVKQLSPEPKWRRAAEVKPSSPKPNRRRATEVKPSSPKPKRQRATEVKPSSPKPKRRRAA
nr:nuclear pore complex-interacting protein family member B13 isoform X3 [Pan troglodytes]